MALECAALNSPDKLTTSGASGQLIKVISGKRMPMKVFNGLINKLYKLYIKSFSAYKMAKNVEKQRILDL